MDTHAHSRTPVPMSESVSGFQIGVVIVGVSITLPLLYSAGELAIGIGFVDALIATFAGALILSVMSVPASIVGARSRLSSYMIIEHTFGSVGAKLINFAFGLFLLGWYAVTADLFGRTLYVAAGSLTTLAFDEWAYTVASSALVIVTTIYGFKAIDRLALVAVPFLLLALIVVVAGSLQISPIGELIATRGEAITLPTAISAVVGAAIVGVVLMPDLTRYARTTRDCVTASFLGQGGGIVVAYVAGMIPVLVWDELEPMRYMMLLGYGWLALAVIVFATWTTNVINLYGVGLAARASIPLGSYASVVIVGGILGTAAAVMGIADHLIDFLLLLGLLVPPIAAVYLCDFFFFARRDYSAAHLEKRPALRTNALIAGIGGGIAAAWAYVSGWSLTTIAPLDSLVISVLLYAGIELATRKFRTLPSGGPAA
ncbi:MAG: cytosine permease [Woeseiaceae bacterium]|nr:cytosine permease [Woeseiaceae bacterium]